MGAQQVYAGGVANYINDAAVGAVNNVAAGTLDIAGSLGTKTVNVAANSTAKAIADQVNGVTSNTGVTATATTLAKIDNVATGAQKFTLYGKNTTGEDISVNITNTNDLSEMADAINTKAARTGVYAELSADKSSITLRNSEGYDIQIDNTGGLAIDVTGLNADGSSTGLTTQTVTTGPVTVGGNVTFNAEKSFSVTDTGANVVDSAAAGSLLQSVGTIDIGSREGANRALAIVDNAIALMDGTRADLGAIQNRFESTIANLQNISENVSAARSRIQDADIAQETSEMTKQSILQQAGVAILAQANQSQQLALTLLR
ncbi:MAG: hypothetical protein FWD79_10255 [Desulfobulbus sp.]|nr:hypothetical protein [Desulfobulbus sp.]